MPPFEHFPPIDPASPPAPIAAGDPASWMVDPQITFLNHGSFGARTHRVHEAHQRWTRRFESSPVLFLDRQRDELMDHAKGALGAALGMRADDFGFVTNATGGVNAVLRSMQIRPGDELLTTTHVYNAVRQTMRLVAEARGATYREIDLPLPAETQTELKHAIVDALAPRTRLLVVDHVTSPTAIVLPIHAIARACAQRDIEVLVDGAHAPGMLPLDVESVGATYYTGNLHKWVCAPPGAAFLWVRPDRQETVHPNTISHFLGEGFAREFSWQATRDITPWLTVTEALAFLDEHGWDAVMTHNHALASWAHMFLCEALDLAPMTSPDGSVLGSMASIVLPAGFAAGLEPMEVVRLIYDRFAVEVPVFDLNGRRYLRVSAQVYNRPEDYVKLVSALRELAPTTGSLRS